MFKSSCAFGDPRVWMHTNIVQQFFEFQLDCRHNAGLRAITADETGYPFVQFMGKGIDPFEADYKNPSDDRKPMDSAKFKEQFLQTCFSCHSDPGIFSVLSYTGFFPSPGQQYPADLALLDSDRAGRDAIYWKKGQYSWGLLQGLWAGK